MKKIMNKKGFTLVELLAVIVILAVIILVAMNAVVPQMQKARRNAFKTEATSYLNAAETWYTNNSIMNPTETCVTIGFLNANYIKKTGGEKYTGYVVYAVDTKDADKDSNKNEKLFFLYLNNTAFSVNGKSTYQIAEDNLDAATPIQHVYASDETGEGEYVSEFTVPKDCVTVSSSSEE